MVAASFASRSGDGVQIDAPSEANMRANEKTDPWPRNGWRFLMIDRVPLAIPGFGRYRALDETMKKERKTVRESAFDGKAEVRCSRRYFGF
jgi:hypothetical protein